MPWPATASIPTCRPPGPAERAHPPAGSGRRTGRCRPIRHLCDSPPRPAVQRSGHPRHPVRPVALDIDADHGIDQPGLIDLRIGRPLGLTGAPVVMGLARHPSRRTGHSDRELIGRPGRHPRVASHCPGSFTRKSVAHSSRSRSIRNGAFSGHARLHRPSRRSSTPPAHPDQCPPGGPTYPTCPHRSGRQIDDPVPPSITIATASLLNSSVELRPDRPDCSIAAMAASSRRLPVSTETSGTRRGRRRLTQR